MKTRHESRFIPQVAGLLLTGGRSRRMGADKASIIFDGVSMAAHASRVLLSVASPVIEIGPGRTGLPAVLEEPPGGGPLVAIGAGIRALRQVGHTGSALVLACDHPLVTVAALAMLVNWPGDRSVVPVVGGRAQPLCARWSEADLESVTALIENGERSMKSLLARPGILLLDEASWPEQVQASAFADADTPADLDNLRKLGRMTAPMAPDAQTWLDKYAAALGTSVPSPAEVEVLLALAGTAAHASERLAAPLSCWMAAAAGLSPAEALAVAEDLATSIKND